jgi:sulfite dehydrogenase (cytochrome) subunit B
MRAVAIVFWLGVCVAPLAVVRAESLSYTLPEETAALRAGPGIESAEKNCSACHSAEYIAYQPPKRGRAFWEAEVQKMIKVYGAPIDETDAKAIADYLAQTY